MTSSGMLLLLYVVALAAVEGTKDNNISRKRSSSCTTSYLLPALGKMVGELYYIQHQIVMGYRTGATITTITTDRFARGSLRIALNICH